MKGGRLAISRGHVTWDSNPKHKVLIPPCHPRSKILPPLTSVQLAEATPIRLQVTARLNKVNKHLKSPISLQYIHRNYHVLKEPDMVLAFTLGTLSNRRFR